MIKILSSAVFLLICHTSVICQQVAIPKVKSGKIFRHDKFPSRFVTARNIDVWLPEGYDPSKRYPVLYMHDGQMLFDASITWNKQEWGVDETASKLIAIKRLDPFIVVGVWNAVAERHIDYFPQKPFESLSAPQMDSIYTASRNNGQAIFSGKVQSDKYLQFLVTELKPFIDKTYSTFTDPFNTFIAGSSMGGLISLYAICEYPEVFGGAACISTHWPGIFSVENNPVPLAFFNYMQAKLPDPATHRIYFDYGDSTLDAMYPPLQKKADAIMRARNYDARSWTTQYFPGEDHSEKAWNRRLDIPLVFLMKKK
jgi:predicted alpha/beta superfamily hydrolase